MSGHTPGPWQLDQGTCHTGAIATLHGEGKAWFEVWSRNWGQNQPGHTEANALLVCAAPDLLEVLEAIDQWEGDLVLDPAAWADGLPRFTQAAYDRWMELQTMRNAAVAKARGEP